MTIVSIASFVSVLLLVSLSVSAIPGQFSGSASGGASSSASGGMSAAGGMAGKGAAGAGAGGAANAAGGVSMEAAVQMLAKMRGLLCVVPPPAADEVNQIMNCCPLMQFFNGHICDACRNEVYGAGKEQLKNMCKGSNADAVTFAQKLMKCGMDKMAQAGNPVKSLTPNTSFLSKEASCAKRGLTMMS